MEQQFYQDPSDKKWKKVDNTLKNSASKPGKFENTANDVKTFFAGQSGNGELVTVEKDDKSVSLVPVEANKVPGSVKENEVTFKGLLQDVDVSYHVNGSAVKEDIILNQFQNKNTFSFELKQKGVTPHKEKNGTIVFKDAKGNTVWFFETPYMTDAAGKYSEKVSLQLREESGKTFVDVVADLAFLKDPATKYPVTIDPTIDNWNVLRDNFIASSFPDSIYASNTYMDTGYNSYFGSTRALARFSLPALPSDSVITSATFNAYQTQNDGLQQSVDLYRVTSDWPSATTWNTQPSTAATKESTATSATYNAYWSWDISKLAKDWYNGIQANYGFMLKQQNEATSPYRSFNSVNSGTNTPRLSINYRVEAIGLESFWTNTKDSVNPANGNLVYQEKDLDIQGRGETVSLTRTFNNRKSQTKGIFGYGWFTNLEKNIWDTGSGPIIYVDEDNTRHIFGEKPGGGYEAAGGVYLDLTKNIDGTYTITKTDGTKTNFNTNRKVSSIVDTNGNTTTFVYDAAGKLTKIQDASGRQTILAYGTNGSVSSVTDPAGRVTAYEYDASGNLIKVTDPEANITTFSYDADHNITGITDARSIKTTYGYDTSDRVTSISRPITINGVAETSQTTYGYDTTNLVTSVTDGEGKRIDYTTNANGNVVQMTENPLDAVNKAVTTYGYDNNNNLTKVIDPNTNKANGTSSYVYTYDAKGNVTGRQLPEKQNATYNYDSQNNLIKEQDFNQNISTNDYDGNNNQTETTDANVQTSASRYDAKGNLLYDTHPMSAADNMITNSGFELDKNADNWPDYWQKYTDNGGTADFAWSGTGKFGNKAVSISNPTTWAIVRSDKFEYKAGETYIASSYVKTNSIVGSALLKIEFFDDQNNWLGQSSSPQLKGTHDWTRLQAVIDTAPANTTKISVSAGLNPGTGTAYFDGVQLEKGTTISAYNLVENSSFERDTDQDGKPDNWDTSGNLSMNDKIVQNVNSGDDNVYIGKSSFQMTGEAAKNKYLKQRINLSGDANTKLTLSGWSKQVGTNPNGGYYSMQIAINYTDGTTDWDYANGFDKAASDWKHVAAEVNPKKAFNSIDVYYYYYNQTGTAWFDAMRLEIGASITSNTYDAGGNYVTAVKDQVGNIVSYSYDSIGNKTSITDAKSSKTSFVYDNKNRLLKVTDPNLGITNFGYDGNGNRTTLTDANNNVTNIVYNEINQISSITNPISKITKFEYDRNGNKTKIISANGDTVSYTLNSLNRVDGVYYNGVKKWGMNYDGNGNVTSIISDKAEENKSFSYDKNNRVIQKVEGSTNHFDYIYDSNGNLTSESFTVGTSKNTVDRGFNSLNQLISLSRNGGKLAKFIYDERGNLNSIKYSNGTFELYSYDDGNRIMSVQNYSSSGELLGKFVYSYDANGNQNKVQTTDKAISYQYDKLNRLINETLKDGTSITYDYDAVGNRIRKTETLGTSNTIVDYTYNAANHLTSVNGQSYSYDNNGNLVNNGSKSFIYNEENRLIEVKSKTGESLVKFTYDLEGRRASKTTATGTIYFHYNGQKIMNETDSQNNIIAEYTWDSKGKPVTMTKGGITYYYHLNGHGDVIMLTDQNGSVVAEYEYDAWGNIVSKTGTMAASNPLRYTSYYYDDEIGFYYLLARYYDPKNGGFITRDAHSGSCDSPLTQNGYSYANNNPVMVYDPDGNNGLKVWGNWCGPKHGGGPTKGKLDECCKAHDRCYGSTGYFACSCDNKLEKCINSNYSKMTRKGEKAAANAVKFHFRHNQWCRWWL
ncbi:DNRLRE domain-containing protein [Bacillus canaveralius]|uniref:DNRLRE domain-containing protein n=1 Tax=Bacillus canaveralius TaxID=1403243 RepID=UPI0021AE116A|nr:DNRLRE domain-containing protein [Bacillus canaveralius]